MKQLTLLLLLFILLTACAGKSPDRTITGSDVQHIVHNIIQEDRFLLLDKEDIEFVLSISPTEYEHAWVWLDKNGSTIDEIGIFIVDSNADTLYQNLKDYVSACKTDKKEWLESYNPTEAIKLQNGKLFRYGNCMGYVFLNENDQTQFMKELNEFYS